MLKKFHNRIILCALIATLIIVSSLTYVSIKHAETSIVEGHSIGIAVFEWDKNAIQSQPNGAVFCPNSCG